MSRPISYPRKWKWEILVRAPILIHDVTNKSTNLHEIFTKFFIICHDSCRSLLMADITLTQTGSHLLPQLFKLGLIWEKSKLQHKIDNKNLIIPWALGFLLEDASGLHLIQLLVFASAAYSQLEFSQWLFSRAQLSFPALEDFFRCLQSGYMQFQSTVSHNSHEPTLRMLLEL